MRAADLIVRGQRVVIAETVAPAALVIENGKIATIEASDTVRPARVHVDAGDRVVMPGLVDTHVHVNEPGRSDWEGFATATRAAAAGGVTTIVDMPLNSSPVTTNRHALARKAAAAEGQCAVDYGFWGGVVPGNADQIPELLAAGVLGCKAFLIDSGIDEFPPVSRRDLAQVMPLLAARGGVLLAHAEAPGPIEAAIRELAGADPRRYSSYLASRPATAEVEAIGELIELCQTTDCAVHIVHLATTEALPLLTTARHQGLPITVETCPHYLTFAAEDIPDGATEFKCAPPIRFRAEREGLWRALGDGAIDLIASDHSPCPPALKRRQAGDFFAAWGGIASLQLTLPTVWTEARRRGHGLADLTRWLCKGPARLAGLLGRKGELAIGYDADLVIWEPDATFTVEGAKLQHRHPLTPYDGRALAGAVRETWVRGARAHPAEPPAMPHGQWLRSVAR